LPRSDYRNGVHSTQRAPLNADIVTENNYGESDEERDDEDMDFEKQRARAKSTDPFSKKVN